MRFFWRKPTYREAMMQAIREAAAPSELFKGTSLAYGLRCIRTFERVNNLPFDPFNKLHRDTTRHMAVHEATFRRVRFIREGKRLGGYSATPTA